MLDLNQATEGLTHTTVFNVAQISLIVITVILIALIACFLYGNEDGLATLTFSIGALVAIFPICIMLISHYHSYHDALAEDINPWSHQRYGLDLGSNMIDDIVYDSFHDENPEGKTYIANTAEGESVEVSYVVIDDHLRITPAGSAEEYPTTSPKG